MTLDEMLAGGGPRRRPPGVVPLSEAWKVTEHLAAEYRGAGFPDPQQTRGGAPFPADSPPPPPVSQPPGGPAPAPAEKPGFPEPPAPSGGAAFPEAVWPATGGAVVAWPDTSASPRGEAPTGTGAAFPELAAGRGPGPGAAFPTFPDLGGGGGASVPAGATPGPPSASPSPAGFPSVGGVGGGGGLGELLAGLDKMNVLMAGVASAVAESRQRPADIGTPPIHREGTTQAFVWSDQEGFAAASPSTDHSSKAGLMGAGGTGPRDQVRFLEPGKRRMGGK